MSGFADVGGLAIAELDDEAVTTIINAPPSLASEIIAAYRCALDIRGTDMQFLRLPDEQSATVKAVAMGVRPEQLAAGVEQGSRNGIILASDLTAAGFPSMLKKRDRVQWRSEWHTITHDPEIIPIGSTDVRINFVFKG